MSQPFPLHGTLHSGTESAADRLRVYCADHVGVAELADALG